METWDQWKDDKALHRGRDALPRQRADQDFIERAEPGMARAAYSAMPRTIGRLGRDGLPLLPSSARPAVRRRDGEKLEPEGVQAHQCRGQRSIDEPRDRTRAVPRRRRSGRDGALQLQDGDRADRVDQHHLRRCERVHRADPGQHLHPQDVERLMVGKEPASRKAADREIEELGCSVEYDPRARRLGPAPRFPLSGGKGRVQDQLRDRSALAARTRRRPHALYRSGAVASICSSRRTSTNGTC